LFGSSTATSFTNRPVGAGLADFRYRSLPFTDIIRIQDFFKVFFVYVSDHYRRMIAQADIPVYVKCYGTLQHIKRTMAEADKWIIVRIE
jgi:hypothetical protein